MSNLIYGPNTEQVTAFIERCKVLTGDETERIVAWYASRDVSRGGAWFAANLATWDSLHRDVSRAGARNDAWIAARGGAWFATRYAACAIVVMDLITAEQFAILTEPFAEILVELGIVDSATHDMICMTQFGAKYPLYVKGERKVPKIILKNVEIDSGLLERLINALEKIEASEAGK